MLQGVNGCNLCQLRVNTVRLPTERSVSVELIWNIPEAFMAQQAQAALHCQNQQKSRNTLAGSAKPEMIKTHND